MPGWNKLKRSKVSAAGDTRNNIPTGNKRFWYILYGYFKISRSNVEFKTAELVLFHKRYGPYNPKIF